jgi:hypothetical protein
MVEESERQYPVESIESAALDGSTILCSKGDQNKFCLAVDSTEKPA